MPRFSLSGRRGGSDKKSQAAELDLQQQALDQQQMGGMTHQLATMLGLSNETQALPAKLAALGAQTKSTELANEHQTNWGDYLTGLGAQGQESNIAGQKIQQGLAQHQLDWAPYMQGLAAQGQELGLDKAYVERQYLPGQLQQRQAAGDLALQDATLTNQRAQEAAPWDETMRQLQYDQGQEQIKGFEAVANQRGQLHPETLMYLVDKGYLKPEDLDSMLSPEMAAKVQQRRALQQQQKAEGRAVEDQHGLNGPPPQVQSGQRHVPKTFAEEPNFWGKDFLDWVLRGQDVNLEEKEKREKREALEEIKKKSIKP